MGMSSSKTVLVTFAQSFHLNDARLVNPYVQPVLYIRRPEDDLEQTIRFRDDDPFFSEVNHYLCLIGHGDA